MCSFLEYFCLKVWKNKQIQKNIILYDRGEKYSK